MEIFMIRVIYFSIYFLLNVYFIVRTFSWADHCFSHSLLLEYHVLFAFLWLLVASSLIVSHFLQYKTKFRRLHRFAAHYFGVFFYAIFYTLVVDLFILVCTATHLASFDFFLSIPVARMTGFCILLATALTCLYGSLHVTDIQLVRKDVHIYKPWRKSGTLKIALIADFHLGYSIGAREMEHMAALINKENVDLICVTGDIYDNNFAAIEERDRIQTALASMHASYGVYGCWGNHDVEENRFSGFSVDDKHKAIRTKEMEDFMRQCHITMLADETCSIADNSICLIGRKDNERAGDGTNHRIPLADLMEQVDRTKPVIVLDHSPKSVPDAAMAGTDLLLSGHTHKGQLFPMNYTNLVAFGKNQYGVHTHGHTTNAVTSGVGIYGPKMRVGSDSEIMILTVSFSQSNPKPN